MLVKRKGNKTNAQEGDKSDISLLVKVGTICVTVLEWMLYKVWSHRSSVGAWTLQNSGNGRKAMVTSHSSMNSSLSLDDKRNYGGTDFTFGASLGAPILHRGVILDFGARFHIQWRGFDNGIKHPLHSGEVDNQRLQVGIPSVIKKWKGNQIAFRDRKNIPAHPFRGYYPLRGY